LNIVIDSTKIYTINTTHSEGILARLAKRSFLFLDETYALLSSVSSGLLGLFRLFGGLLLARPTLLLAERTSGLGHGGSLLSKGSWLGKRFSSQSVASFGLLQHSSSVESKEYLAENEAAHLGALLSDGLSNGGGAHGSLVLLQGGHDALSDSLTTPSSLGCFAGGSSLLLFGGLSRLSLSGGFLGLSRFSGGPLLALLSLLGLFGFLGFLGLSLFLAIRDGGDELLLECELFDFFKGHV